MNMTEQTYCGIASLTGRPNVGKSTLLNQLVAQKISITSRKKQTTRQTIRGIKTQGNQQIIFVDTPGLHQKERSRLNHYMNQTARDALLAVDLIIMVMEAGKITHEDIWILKLVLKQPAKKILVINKIDQLPDKKQLLPQMNRIQEEATASDAVFHAIIPLSAFLAQDIALLQQQVMQWMPVSPFLFPEHMVTDLNENQLISEIIREQLIRFTGQELPYQTHVAIEQNKPIHKVQHIYAVIYVARPGQKLIILGQDGIRLKKMATIARKNMEKLMDKKVMLRLWIKVKENWTDDKIKMQQLGYFR